MKTTGKTESWTIEGVKGEGKLGGKARKNRREARDAEARKHESRNQGCGFAEKIGAEERTRTSTGKPPLDPEPSASTSSATSAQIFLQPRPPFNRQRGIDFVQWLRYIDGFSETVKHNFKEIVFPMKVVHGLDSIDKPFTRAVLTIGNFDGVHLGHQAIYRHLIDKARLAGLPATVITFEPQPQEFGRASCRERVCLYV